MMKGRSMVIFCLKSSKLEMLDYLKEDFEISRNLQCFDAVGWAAGRASGL